MYYYYHNNKPREEDYEFKVGEIVTYVGLRGTENEPCKVLRRDWTNTQDQAIYRLERLKYDGRIMFGSHRSLRKSKLGEAVLGEV